MATGKYTSVEGYIEGAKLAEAMSVTVGHASQAQVVETLARGFAGLSPGAPHMTISCANAVPADDFEYDPTTAIKLNTVVEFTIYAAGKSLTSKGFFLTCNFSGAVNSPSNLSFEFIGEYATWTAA